MKTFFIALLAVGALALAFGDRPGTTDSEASWDQGIERVDGYLEEGLSEETHDTISSNARDGAHLIVSFGNEVGTVVE
jgi:hypothetical protein